MVGLMAKIFGGWIVAIMTGMPLYTSMALAALVFIEVNGLPVGTLAHKMAGSMNSFPIVAAPLLPAGLLTVLQAFADMRKPKPEAAGAQGAPQW